MRHNPRCRMLQDPPSLQDPNDCDCGAIPPLRRRVASDWMGHDQVLKLANWWARTLVADEYTFAEPPPLPDHVREMIAEQMVAQECLGWPDVESALAHLDELYPREVPA